MQNVEERNIRYMTNYDDASQSDYITWQNALGTSNKAASRYSTFTQV